MATVDQLIIELKLQNDQLSSGLKKSQSDFKKSMDGMEKEVGELQKAVEKGTKKSGLAFAAFAGGLAANLATKGISLFGNALKGLFNSIVVDGIANAKSAELAFVKLSTAFSLAGQDGKAATDEFAKFASGLQMITTSGDDATIGMAAVIQSLAKLDQEGLQAATKASLDMAAALGIDATTAANLVGKAAAGQVSSLTRYGVSIKATGDAAVDGANALKALNEQFGGSAAAATKTFDGRTKQLKNAFDDLTESFGLAITKNGVITETLGAVSKVVFDLIAVVEQNRAAIAEFIAVGLVGAINAFGIFVEMVNVTIKGLLLLKDGFDIALEGSIALAFALQGNFEAAADHIAAAGKEVDEFKKTLSDPGPLDAVTEKIAEIGFEAEKALDKERATGFQTALGGVNTTATKIKETLIEASQAAKDFAASLVKRGEDPFADISERSEFLKQQREQDLLTEEEFFLARNEMLMAQFELENQLLAEALAGKAITEDEHRIAQLQLEQEHSAAKMALKTEEVKTQKALDKEREANLKSSLGTIAGLQSSSSTTLQAIGKGAAIATATMDGIVAVQKALASAPPPFNFALAALVGAATASNIAKISGVGLQSGIDSVPGVGSRDNFPAVLAPGERVVPRKTNQDLSSFLAGQGGGSSGPRVVNNNTFNISGILPSDGEMVIKSINDALAKGSIGLLTG